ncbi:MAG: nucleotide exchange factor GrpE [Magnetococcales bacterium]|nr:nucleotide exchange factor GrpE [Magnetococcales bacterium]
MDQEALIARFRDFLQETPVADNPERVDLYTLFVELSALKNEVRLESRQVKTALEGFRALTEPLRSGYAALEEENTRLRTDCAEAGGKRLRPLLLELLELRDRMAAGLEATSGRKLSKLFRRFCRKEEERLAVWREGQEMTLRRLDQILAGLGVEPVAVLHRPLDPRMARAVRAECHKGVAHGLVVSELRRGFLWQGELLRPAEVVVNREEGA